MRSLIIFSVFILLALTVSCGGSDGEASRSIVRVEPTTEPPTQVSIPTPSSCTLETVNFQLDDLPNHIFITSLEEEHLVVHQVQLWNQREGVSAYSKVSFEGSTPTSAPFILESAIIVTDDKTPDLEDVLDWGDFDDLEQVVNAEAVGEQSALYLRDRSTTVDGYRYQSSFYQFRQGNLHYAARLLYNQQEGISEFTAAQLPQLAVAVSDRLAACNGLNLQEPVYPVCHESRFGVQPEDLTGIGIPVLYQMGTTDLHAEDENRDHFRLYATANKNVSEEEAVRVFNVLLPNYTGDGVESTYEIPPIGEEYAASTRYLEEGSYVPGPSNDYMILFRQGVVIIKLSLETNTPDFTIDDLLAIAQKVVDRIKACGK